MDVNNEVPCMGDHKINGVVPTVDEKINSIQNKEYIGQDRDWETSNNYVAFFII